MNATCLYPVGMSATSVAERSLRIALFSEVFLPKIDGVVTRLCQTIRHLRAAGHMVLVIAPDWSMRRSSSAVGTGLEKSSNSLQ